MMFNPFKKEKEQNFYGKCWLKKCKENYKLFKLVDDNKKWMDKKEIEKHAKRCDDCFYEWWFFHVQSRITRAIANALRYNFK